MKYRIYKNQSGVTLVELLIVMGLLSVFMIVIATIFTSAVDVQQQSTSYSATQVNGSYIMARLNYDIARATSINVPYTYGDYSPSLSLEINGIDNTYSLTGSNLTLLDNVGTDNLNDSDVTVSNLSFQRIGNPGGVPTIIYSFTLTSTALNHGLSSSQTFSGTEGLSP